MIDGRPGDMQIKTLIKSIDEASKMYSDYSYIINRVQLLDRPEDLMNIFNRHCFVDTQTDFMYPLISVD